MAARTFEVVKPITEEHYAAIEGHVFAGGEQGGCYGVDVYQVVGKTNNYLKLRVIPQVSLQADHAYGNYVNGIDWQWIDDHPFDPKKDGKELERFTLQVSNDGQYGMAKGTGTTAVWLSECQRDDTFSSCTYD